MFCAATTGSCPGTGSISGKSGRGGNGSHEAARRTFYPGGADSEIVLIGREAGSGTRSGFEEIVEVKDLCKYRQELSSTGDVITTVAQNPGAIGYASLASVKDTVKAVNVEGVTPNEQSVKDGTYAIQRPFVLATKEGAKLNDVAQAFFDYVTSPDANAVITAAGVVPAN